MTVIDLAYLAELGRLLVEDFSAWHEHRECEVLSFRVLSFDRREAEVTIEYSMYGRSTLTTTGRIDAEFADVMGSARDVAVIVYNDLIEDYLTTPPLMRRDRPSGV